MKRSAAAHNIGDLNRAVGQKPGVDRQVAVVDTPPDSGFESGVAVVAAQALPWAYGAG